MKVIYKPFFPSNSQQILPASSLTTSHVQSIIWKDVGGGQGRGGGVPSLRRWWENKKTFKHEMERKEIFHRYLFIISSLRCVEPREACPSITMYILPLLSKSPYHPGKTAERFHSPPQIKEFEKSHNGVWLTIDTEHLASLLSWNNSELPPQMD